MFISSGRFQGFGFRVYGHGNFCINREFGFYHIRQGIYRVVQGEGLGGGRRNSNSGESYDKETGSDMETLTMYGCGE